MSRIVCGFGYVIVPPDVDRTKYIDSCFASERISFYPEVGGTSYNEALISREALREIEFPEEEKMFGSQIVYLLHPVSAFPIVIAVVSKTDEHLGLGHKEFKLEKGDGSNLVSILGRGKDGNLYVTVQSDKQTGGNVVIHIKKATGDGRLYLEVSGDIIIQSTKAISMNTEDIFRVRAKNKMFLGNKDESAEIGSDDGFQQVVLGNYLDEWVSDFAELLKQLQVATGVGPSGVPLPTWTQQLDQLVNRFKENLSQRVFVE